MNDSPRTGWVAFDFDGVLAQNIWPETGIGEPIQGGFDLANRYEHEHYRIFVHTSRPWSDHDEIVDWLMGFDKYWNVICGKPLADFYVDDKAVAFPEAS